MAVRTGAGTGVIVSLVFFVLTTVCLLVLSIVFYAGQVDTAEELAEARRDLNQFIRPQEQAQDLFQQYRTAAGQQNQSVAMHLHRRIENIMRYLDGDPSTTLEGVRGRFVQYGVDEDGVVRNTLSDMRRRDRQQRDTIDSLNDRVGQLDDQNEELQQRIEQLRAAHREEMEAVQGQIAGYRESAEEFRRELDEAKRMMDQSVARLEDQYENQIRSLQNEVDDVRRERGRLLDRLDDLQDRLSAERIRAQDPATLVDGEIIDVGPGDQVFINRGRNHRIVLGMTFEVFEDAAAIRVDQRTGEMSRGKASIQVIRLHDTTATAKITRSVPGRPVVRGDVIANAVYDPDYQFKFLVHGRFDVDGDGRATATEREYIENLVAQWGGELVEGTELPGDLDFLVLGVRPPEPRPLPSEPTDREMEDWLRAQEARDTYDRLFREAREAQIPVLNHNRFLILIGHTRR